MSFRRPRLLPAAAFALCVAASPASASEGVTAAELLPLERASWPMKVTSGPGAGDSVDLTLEQLPGGGGWAMRLGDRNALRLSEAADGSIEVAEVELSDAGQRLVFSPPALLIPAGHLNNPAPPLSKPPF